MIQYQIVINKKQMWDDEKSHICFFILV